MPRRLHPADLAAILDEIPSEHVAGIFHVPGDKELSAEVFSQMSQGLRKRVMTESSATQLASLPRTTSPSPSSMRSMSWSAWPRSMT